MMSIVWPLWPWRFSSLPFIVSNKNINLKKSSCLTVLFHNGGWICDITFVFKLSHLLVQCIGLYFVWLFVALLYSPLMELNCFKFPWKWFDQNKKKTRDQESGSSETTRIDVLISYRKVLGVESSRREWCIWTTVTLILIQVTW